MTAVTLVLLEDQLYATVDAVERRRLLQLLIKELVREFDAIKPQLTREK